MQHRHTKLSFTNTCNWLVSVKQVQAENQTEVIFIFSAELPICLLPASCLLFCSSRLLESNVRLAERRQRFHGDQSQSDVAHLLQIKPIRKQSVSWS